MQLERDLATMRGSRPGTSQGATLPRPASESESVNGTTSAQSNGVGEVEQNPSRVSGQKKNPGSERLWENMIQTNAVHRSTDFWMHLHRVAMKECSEV